MVVHIRKEYSNDVVGGYEFDIVRSHVGPTILLAESR